MGKSMHKGHHGHYSGNSKFSKRHDEDYDAKEAYNKNLTASARLHYLENDRHDHESPANNIVGAVGKAAGMAAKAAGMAADGAETYKLASAREAMKKAVSEMGKMAVTGGARPDFKAIGEAGQKLLKGSKAIGQKRKKLKAGPDTNYDRRDPDSYFYDEDYAADAGPRKSREELQEQRNEALKAKINKQK